MMTVALGPVLSRAERSSSNLSCPPERAGCHWHFACSIVRIEQW
jgi:hypothetical protein